MLDDSNFRCDYCGELIPDVMLWIENKGSYKLKKAYVTFRWDFCDLHCQKAYLNTKINLADVEEAKHKTKKRKIK